MSPCRQESPWRAGHNGTSKSTAATGMSPCRQECLRYPLQSRKSRFAVYDDDVTAGDPLTDYESKLSAAQRGTAEARVRHTAAAAVFAITIAFILALGVYAIRKQVSVWWPLLPAPLAIFSARAYGQYRRTGSRQWRLKRFYDRALQRVHGDWPGHGSAGEEFNDPSHVYARDLNVFGEGSLFELLCIARSGVGRRGLANFLLQAPSVEETLARQQAVRELSPRTDLREDVALLGPFEFSESKWETFAHWLDSPAVRFPSSVRLVILITSGALAIIIVAALLGLLPWLVAARWMAPLVLLHSGVGLFFRKRVADMIGALVALSAEVRVLREGLHLLERQCFRSPKLSDLAQQVRNGSRSVRRLERFLNALNETNKDWFYLPALVLMLGTQLCAAIEHWRTHNRSALQTWLAAWAEFEALNAFACYSYENPANTFAEMLEGGAHFEATAIGHPLLPHHNCVPNDVELNSSSRFYIVSGSNMAGKSTLLRAIGLNAVLALAGAPVRAQSLRLSHLAVCASLSVSDSLLDGRSKFLAEVDRLREALELTNSGRPVLFLIDEIFGGTNSRDRRVVTESVVRTLIDRGAIGALSTHDLALTEIADNAKLCGANVHMGSKNGDDPMDFDYLLKPGITRETNALAIARMAGVPI
jgi:hypothetical protein